MTYAFNLSQFANNVNSSGKAILTSGQAVTGILPVANGGSGASTLSANAVLVGNGTSAINTVAPSTSGNVLTSNGTAWTSAVPTFNTTSSTLSTSGTLVEFTGISSAAKQITISLGFVSLSGSDTITIQLGTSGGYASTGYENSLTIVSSTGTSQVQTTDGVRINGGASLAASKKTSGSVIFTLISASTNTWGFAGTTGIDVYGYMMAGAVALSGTLTKIGIKSTNGVNTFDAGTIGLCYSK